MGQNTWSEGLRNFGCCGQGALQRDQFIDGLTDADIQESLWEEEIEGFDETIQRALRLNSINKAKQAKQKRRAGPVVRRNAYFEEECDLECGHRTGVNALVEQGSGSTERPSANRNDYFERNPHSSRRQSESTRFRTERSLR